MDCSSEISIRTEAYVKASDFCKGLASLQQLFSLSSRPGWIKAAEIGKVRTCANALLVFAVRD